MIPREILKKIRQIEIRTNRLAKVSLPMLQLLRIMARVEHRQDNDALGFNQKMNHERKPAQHDRPPYFAPDFRKPFRIIRDAVKGAFHDGSEFPPEALALAFVPCDCIVRLLFRSATNDQVTLHPGYFASSLALTSSHETTSLGLSRWACRRRPINSASPGVSSLEPRMLSHRLRHNSICSASGRARASLRTMSELIKFNLQTFRILASP